MRMPGELGYIGPKDPERKGRVIPFRDLRYHIGQRVIFETFRAGYPVITDYKPDLCIVEITGYEEDGYTSYENKGSEEFPEYVEHVCDEVSFKYKPHQSSVCRVPEECCSRGTNTRDMRYGAFPLDNFYRIK